MAAQRRPARAPATAIKPRLNGVHTVQLCHRSLAGTCKSDRAYLSVPEPSRRHLLKCEWHPPVHRKKEPKRDIHRPRAHTHTHIRRHGHAHDCFIFYTTPTSSTRNAPDFQASHGRHCTPPAAHSSQDTASLGIALNSQSTSFYKAILTRPVSRTHERTRAGEPRGAQMSSSPMQLPKQLLSTRWAKGM